jgi:Integrase core domain
MEWPCTLRSAISSRSANDRYRPESGFAEDLNIAGGMPPAFRNNLVPTGWDIPASSAASSLLSPVAIARQNLFCSSRPATGGRPGDGNEARPDRADRRLAIFIATSNFRVLRRPFECKQYVSIKYTERLAEAGVEPSVGSVGDSYDNALAETINGLYKAEVIHRRGPWRSFEAVEFATLEWVDWFNNRRLLEPIGNIPPAEAEQRYYAMLEQPAMAA